MFLYWANNILFTYKKNLATLGQSSAQLFCTSANCSRRRLSRATLDATACDAPCGGPQPRPPTKKRPVRLWLYKSHTDSRNGGIAVNVPSRMWDPPTKLASVNKSKGSMGAKHFHRVIHFVSRPIAKRKLITSAVKRAKPHFGLAKTASRNVIFSPSWLKLVGSVVQTATHHKK